MLTKIELDGIYLDITDFESIISQYIWNNNEPMNYIVFPVLWEIGYDRCFESGEKRYVDRN